VSSTTLMVALREIPESPILMVGHSGETAIVEALMGGADVYWNASDELVNCQLECAHYLNDMAANWN